MLTRRNTINLAIAIIAFTIAIALSIHAATGALLPNERDIVDELQHVPGGEFWEFFANLFALELVEFAALFGAAGWAWHKGDRLLAVSMLLVLVARTLNTPFKYLIDRPRPGADDIIIRDPGEHPGFPSGHASTVVLVYGYAAIVAIRHSPRLLAMGVYVLALLIILLIGWDRVYDGAHWPSDVLGGYAVGLSLLMIAVAAPPVAMRLRNRWRRRRAVGHSEIRGLG